MIKSILAFAIQRRWLVMWLSLGAALFGAWSLMRLPIDAVPDITNKQVQVHTTAPAPDIYSRASRWVNGCSNCARFSPARSIRRWDRSPQGSARS